MSVVFQRKLWNVHFSFSGTYFYDPFNLFFCPLSTKRLWLLGCIVEFQQGHGHNSSTLHNIQGQRWNHLLKVTQWMVKTEDASVEVQRPCVLTQELRDLSTET